MESGRRDAAPVDPAIPIALLVDLSSGQTLFARDPDRRFVPASVTKVMTAYSAFRLIRTGDLRLSRRVSITQKQEDDWYAEGSNMFLRAGERPSIAQLLMGITTVSANDASVVLGETAAGSLSDWLATMNANAAELGLRNTHFGTPNGWPDEGRTFTSARDMATLAEAMIVRYPGLYRQFFGHRTMRWRDITQANHDPVTGRVAGADGIKTGFTREAGHNFVGSAERDGRRLIVVLAGAPDARTRDRSARDLLEWGFSAFESEAILPAGRNVARVGVQDGADTSVPVRTESVLRVSRPGGDAADVKLTLRYRGPVVAPIAEGQRIATLRVSVEGQPDHDVPLVAAQAVTRANVWQRLRNGLSAIVS